MSSYRLVIQERVSNIHTHIFPAIHLDPTKQYELGLIQFSVFNTTFNITETNNKLYFYEHLGPDRLFALAVPPDSYTFETLLKAIKHLIPENIIKFTFNTATQKYTIATHGIHLLFIRPDSILSVFGFPTYAEDVAKIKTTDPFFTEDNSEESSNDPIIFIPPPPPLRSRREIEYNPPPIILNIADEAVQAEEKSSSTPKDDPTSTHISTGYIITSKNLPDTLYTYQTPFKPSLIRSKYIFVTCPLITNSYKNNAHSPVLHSFHLPPASVPHVSFVEVPSTAIYLPLNHHLHYLGDIVLRIEDENSTLIDFGGEYIRIVLHIREKTLR